MASDDRSAKLASQSSFARGVAQSSGESAFEFSASRESQPSEVSHRARSELLKIAAAGGLRVSVASLAAALLVGYSIRADAPLRQTLGWLALVGLGAAVQFHLSRDWSNATASPMVSPSADLGRWERRAAIGALLNGIAWGLFFSFFDPADPYGLLTCALTLDGTLVLFAVAYGLSPLFYPCYAVPIVVAQAALFLQPGVAAAPPVVASWAAFCVLVFLLHRVAVGMHRRRVSEEIAAEKTLDHWRRVEREQRDNQERFSVALDALQSGVWDYSTADQQFFTSPRFRRVLGYPQETDLDPHLKRLFFYHERIHEDDRQRIAEARQEFLNHGAAFDEQYRLQMPGRIVWIRESAQAALGLDGKPVRFTGSISDVTASTEIQQQLRESERLHRSLIETIDSLIWHADGEGVLTFVNERGARSLYGYEVAEMVGHKTLEFAAPESLKPETLAEFDRLAQRARVRNLEMVHIHKSGARIYVSVNAVPLFDENHRYVGAVGINTNISHIKKRQRSFQETVRLQRLIFDSAGEGMVIVRNGRVYRANQAFVDLLGGTKGDVAARPLSTWFENPEGWRHIEMQLEAIGNVIKVEQPMRCLDGRSIWVLATGRLANAEDYAQAAIWVFVDITSKKREEDLSWHRANHDELTGLPNRRMLQDRIEQALGHARRESGRIALLMLDLDGFKQINDTHGHRVGDEVLRQIAGRMSADVRQLDTVARLGGDEFMMVLHSIESIQDVEARAQRLIDRIQQTITFENIEIHMGTSIGISIFPDSADSLLGLMHAADLAMYAAKASGKNTYRFAESLVRISSRLQGEDTSG